MYYNHKLRCGSRYVVIASVVKRQKKKMSKVICLLVYLIVDEYFTLTLKYANYIRFTTNKCRTTFSVIYET